MNSLKHLKTTAPGFPDLLNYASVVAPGVVVCKDGSLLAGWQYLGDDHDALTTSEINSITGRVNDKLKRLGDGWTLSVDATRISASGYPAPDRIFFDDPVSRLIDEERRDTYESEQGHFETFYIMTLNYLPPKMISSRIADMMYMDYAGSEKKKISIGEDILEKFILWTNEFQKSFSDILYMVPLTSYTHEDEYGIVTRDRLVEYLHFCMTGLQHPINLAKQMPFLDGVIGGVDVIAGLAPVIGEKHLATVSVTGFPGETFPRILGALDTLPMQYRWSNRFIYMDPEQAVSQLNKFRRKWKQKERGMIDQLTGKDSGKIDYNAVAMTQETDMALSEVSSGVIRFGYFTTLVVLMEEDREILDENASTVLNLIRNLGFSARVETLNALEAYLGSLPGHPFYNIRRPILHTYNVSDILPLSSVWPGKEFCPCDKYPAESPALLYADTTGKTAFRLNLHVGDLGHTLIFGPTGAGKSTLLAFIATQFTKYRDSTLFFFDKGYSVHCLTMATGNMHYDIASEDSSLQFCPLSKLEDESDLIWAQDWIQMCCELQLKRDITPMEKSEIHHAIQLTQKSESKTLTHFTSILQIEDLRQAMEHYTLAGQMGGLLDARTDSLSLGKFIVFEMEHLMELNDDDKLPVLLYIFRQIEKNLKGRPTMIILDEAWVMLGHEKFREKLRSWLKVLRKNNCVVVMATQSLSDADNSGIVDVLIESCPTKIYLPNAAAKSDYSKRFYEKVGLNSTQIDLLSRAVPKRQYYVVSPEGNRMFEMSLGPVALSFVAQSGVATKNEILERIAKTNSNGDDWVVKWLADNGVSEKYQKKYITLKSNQE